MKFKATLRAPRFDRQSYIRELASEMNDILARAAFEWLEAATSEIPEWSGASRATFLHLAREVGFVLSAAPVSGAPNRVGLGLRRGDGGFEVDASKGQFFFKYETDLRHLIFNEYNNANAGGDPHVFFRLLNPGPYRFQEKGKAAFERIVAGVRLPDAVRFIKVKRTFRVR